MTPTGERIVAWQEFRAGTSDIEDTVVRIAAPGGGFGAQQTFPTGNGEDLSLASGSDGTVALAWSDSTSSSGADLHIARQAPGQPEFTEATPLPLGTFTSDAPHVAVQNGDVYIALDTSRFDGNVKTTTVRVVRLAAGAGQIQPVNGPAGPSLDQASFNTSNQPSTIVDGSQIAVEGGTVQVAWERLQDAAAGTTTSTTLVQRATAAAGGGPFGATVPVDSSTITFTRAESAQPLLAAGHGRVDLAWLPSSAPQIDYQELTSGGATQHIATSATSLRAGIDSSGALVLGWQAFTATDGAEAVFADIVPPGGQAGPLARLTPFGGNRQLDDLVVGGDGSVLAVPDQANFEPFGDATEHVQASFRAPGLAFGALEDVSGAQDQTGNAIFDTASGALGGAGNALIAWTADDGSGVANSRVFLSQRDAVPPTLGSIIVPPTATAGRNVALSAVATDAMSTVALSWDFGDGAAARGTSVTHTYGAPGTYTVTVRALDSAGNTVSQTRLITVATAKDTTPPVITRLGVTNKRFIAAHGRTALIAARRKTPSGTAFRFAISERATAVLTLTRTGKGRHPSETIIRAGRGPGNVSIPFSGRLDGRALSSGTYTASITAIDGSGNRSRPRTVGFTVVPR